MKTARGERPHEIYKTPNVVVLGPVGLLTKGLPTDDLRESGGFGFTTHTMLDL